MRKSSRLSHLLSPDNLLAAWGFDRLRGRRNQATRDTRDATPLHWKGRLRITPTTPQPQRQRAYRGLRRSRPGAWWDAWMAVWRGMSCAEYLHWRYYSKYLAALPLHYRPLHDVVTIDEQGGITRHPVASPGARNVPLTQAQQDLERLDAQLAQVEANYGALEDEWQRAVADGTAPALTTLSRAPKARGRPRLPCPWRPMGCALLIAVTLLVEAYQVGLPFLNMMGIDTGALLFEWQRNRLGVLAGGGFALATSLALLILSSVIIRATKALAATLGTEPWQTTALRALLPLGLFLCLGLTAWGIGSMRHGVSQEASLLHASLQSRVHAAQANAGVFLLLTLLVPLAVAYVHEQSSVTWAQQRQQVRAQQARWDQVAQQERMVWDRYAERRRPLEERQTSLRQARPGLQQRLATLAQDVESTAQRQQAVLDRLVAALETDRYYFLKAAHKPRRAPGTSAPPVQASVHPYPTSA